MKRVLLTGATGFIGANLTRRLLLEGHEVHLLLRKEHKPWRIVPIINDVHKWTIDLSDKEALLNNISTIKPDWVFHLAVYGAYSSQADFRQMAETNLMATASLVDVCNQVGFEALINTGSSSEYGYKDYAPSEDEWIEPNSPYAILKAASTHYCRYIAQTHKSNMATLRLYSVFGPYEEPSRLIPTLIVEGLQGKLPHLVNPNIARDYVYIDDVCEAYVKAASKPDLAGAVYNIGSGKQLSLQQVVDETISTLSIKTTPVWGSMPDRKWDTSKWVANINRANDELKWQPRVSFSKGLKMFTKWMTPERFSFYKNNRQNLT